MRENREESIGKKMNSGYAVLIAAMSLIAVATLTVLFVLTGRYRAALDDYGFSQGDVGGKRGGRGQSGAAVGSVGRLYPAV